MIRWLRRMLGYSIPDRRAHPRPAPVVHQLPSTSAELAATEPVHRQRLAKADRILRDYQRMDGALRLVKR